MTYKKFKIVFSIFVLVSILIACSSRSKLKFGIDPLKQQALYVEKCGAFTCVNEVNAEVQADLAKHNKKMLQIYLIRHAKPDVKKKVFCSAEQAQQYVKAYNSVPIIPFDPDLVSVNLNSNHTIYCSSLPRSQETALNIFGNQYPVVADSIFREFEIRMIDANSFLKLPMVLWQGFSRASWMLGYNHRGIESHKEAKIRAEKAAKNLIKVASKEETAILVAHGMLNGSIAKSLEKEGWKPIQKQGHINLGATILVKIVDL